MTPLEDALRSLRGTGRKLVAPYVTAGFPTPQEFPALVRGIADAGADLIEVGIPFTDPLMDGPVVQRALQIALEAEVRPAAALRLVEALDVQVPLVLMTYVNPVLAMGWDAYADAAAGAGASGVIVPDLPPEEGEPWASAAHKRDLAPIFLAAPTTPPDRVLRIVELGAGFVYCVSLLGVTGVREALSDRARAVVELVRAATDRPALVGLGVSTPEQASAACAFSDGVIVGSAVLKAVFDGGVKAAVDLVAAMREAVDAGQGAT